jgi:hypothetical protein
MLDSLQELPAAAVQDSPQLVLQGIRPILFLDQFSLNTLKSSCRLAQNFRQRIFFASVRPPPGVQYPVVSFSPLKSVFLQ